MYVLMDRKTENGEEIHNAAFGRLFIMVRIDIVKSASNEEEKEDDEDNIPHGKKIMKELVIPLSNTYRIVCADSYFASVPAAE